jgi:hypothetical protein
MRVIAFSHEARELVVKTSTGTTRTSRTKMRGLALLAAVSAGLLALPATASAGPGDIIAPEGPIDIGPPAIPAKAVRPFASCAVRSINNGSVTYWFGYTNDQFFEEVIPVGANNSLAIQGVGFDNGQGDYFRSGTFDNAVAVSAPAKASVSWTITSVGDGATPVTTTATANIFTSDCLSPAKYSANVRVAGASITRSTVAQFRRKGALSDAYDKFDVSGATVACTAGSNASFQIPLWGYSDSLTELNSGWRRNSAINRIAGSYAPLPSSVVARVDQFEWYDVLNAPTGVYARYTRSYSPVRRVGNTQSAIAGPAPAGTSPYTIKGLTFGEVLAEVQGTCYYNGYSVSATNSAYLFSRQFRTVTDQTTQSHRAFVECTGTQVPLVDACDGLDPTIIGGGGRFRP